jgi:predicted hydrocarbon binding protein
MRRFADVLASELQQDTLAAVLHKAGLPAEWADALHVLEHEQAALTYSKLQWALRTYYGRGARTLLLRIGGILWGRLLGESPLGLKTQAAIVRGLPTGMRRKSALELLPKVLGAENGDMTVHTLDLDLLFVDHVSPTTLGQSDSVPICYVTLGMIHECLFWAVGQEHDIEEVSCRALGAKACEFKIVVGG